MQIAIRIDDLSPPTGEAFVDEKAPQAFAGWLGLLSILEQALRPQPAPQGDASAGLSGRR